MQEFRDEWNEHRIDKLEESLFSEWDHSTKIFKEILEALETLQKITKNLDQRVQRLEALVLFKEEEDS